MRAWMNRGALTVVGLALLVGGLAVVARSQGWLRGLLHTPHKALVTPSQSQRLTHHDWWWWVAIGVPAAVAVICLWWLLAQFRRRLVPAIEVYEAAEGPQAGPSGLGTGFGMVGDDADTLSVLGGALADAVQDDLERVPGVDHGSARLVRHRDGPRLLLWVRTQPGAEPREVLTTVHQDVVGHGRDAVALERLPVRIELRSARGLPARVVE